MEGRDKKYLKGLYEVAAAVNSAHSSASVLNTLLETVAKAMDAKGCSVMLLTPDRTLLVHTAAYGLSDRYIQKGPVSADRSIPEALRGKAVAVVDAVADDRVQYHKESKREGIASILSVAMMIKGKAIGVIRVYTAETRDFSTDDKYFVWAAANLGAIALENAQLYESVKQDKEELIQDLLERVGRVMLN